MSLQHVKALNTSGFIDGIQYFEISANVSMGNSVFIPMVVKFYKDVTGIVSVQLALTQLSTTISTGTININFVALPEALKPTLTQQDLCIGVDSTERYFGGVLRISNTSSWVIFTESFGNFGTGINRILENNVKYIIS
jgi:hypothetical protein